MDVRTKMTFQRFVCLYGWAFALVAGVAAWWLAPANVNYAYTTAASGLVFSVSMLIVGLRRRRQARGEGSAAARDH